MAVTWPDEIDDVLRGDLTAGLAYITPAGGAVVTAVSPIGMRDRERGTVGFTTSLGFGRKLERIKREPKVALAYHAREHGLGDQHNQSFVLVQGIASFDAQPDQDALDRRAEQATPYMGAPRRGRFWDRWLSAYYTDRVVVTVAVTRIITWANPDATGEPEVFGEPLPTTADSQQPPAKGTGPRVDSAKAAARARKLPHCLLAYRQSDGYPAVVPTNITGSSEAGVNLTVPAEVAQGGRRAGILAHSYRPQLVGLECRQHTGWIEIDGTDATYAPHTQSGFIAPPNKTLLLLANGLMARRGLAQARKQGRIAALR
ncbi:hypothetical protein ACIBG0_19420 [Nocardia sp. NPDC050630]|uniref:hypothetical protein n=1 Tax=Nocardia sp. NPDC050630 TaxID=3364321 RepID=UPI00379ED3B6